MSILVEGFCAKYVVKSIFWGAWSQKVGCRDTSRGLMFFCCFFSCCGKKFLRLSSPFCVLKLRRTIENVKIYQETLYCWKELAC